eukprot:TRINITY_DN6096_c0_g1_i2.p1 TRINITY_DN6096_c0_g1~~TRINITY_DN6096_c0_g1_i2.p1  ORF type:complete len:829 (-),score=150.61 TRINITY_DN6096_c0_g1_i2:430-2892(-)
MACVPGKVTTFWVRSDVFQHGLIPLRPDSSLSWVSLQHLVNKYNVAREMSREYFKTINYDMPTVDATLNYTEWTTIAVEDLKFSEIQTTFYWDRYLTLKHSREKRWKKQASTVFFYEFILFLAVQLIGTVTSTPHDPKECDKDTIKDPFIDTEKQIEFIAKNISTLISFLSVNPFETPDGNHKSDKGLIDPEQLVSLGFILGASQSAEKLDLEAENWYTMLPLSKVRGTYLITEVADTIKSNLVVNKHYYHIYGSLPPIPLIPPSSLPYSLAPKTRPRARSRGLSLSSANNVISKNLARPLVIQHINGEAIIKVDPNDVPQSIFVQDEDGEILATYNNMNLPALPTLPTAGTPGSPASSPQKAKVAPGAPPPSSTNSSATLVQRKFATSSGTNTPASSPPAQKKNKTPDSTSNMNLPSLLVNTSSSSPRKNRFATASTGTNTIVSQNSHSRSNSQNNSSDGAFSTNKTNSNGSFSTPNNKTNSSTSSLLSPNTVTGLDDSDGSGRITDPSSELDSEDFSYSGQDSMEEEILESYAEILVSDVQIFDVVDSSVYLLFPMGNVYIRACKRATIVLGAVSGIVTVSGCERCNIIAAVHGLQILSSRKLNLNLLANSRPLLLGDNSNIIFGPYNTHYACLEQHLDLAGLITDKNFWDSPVVYATHVMLHKPLFLEDFKRVGLGGIGGVGDVGAYIKNHGTKKGPQTREEPKETRISWRDINDNFIDLSTMSKREREISSFSKALNESNKRAEEKGGVGVGVSELYQLYDMIGEDFSLHTAWNDIVSPISVFDEKKKEMLAERQKTVSALHAGNYLSTFSVFSVS